jgi:hypothetical protein
MRKTKRSKTKRSKTKRRNRKHNYLGKARIKYYSIKKVGGGPESTRSVTQRNSSRTLTQLSSPVVRDIKDEPKDNKYDLNDPIVVANMEDMRNKVDEVRIKALKAQAMAGQPKVLLARENAQAQVRRAKMAAQSITEQIRAKAANEAEAREKVRVNAQRQGLSIRQ